MDGYLLRHPQDIRRPYQHYSINNQWQRIKRTSTVDITFRTYRHLMPGSIGRAAQVINLGLTA